MHWYESIGSFVITTDGIWDSVGDIWTPLYVIENGMRGDVFPGFHDCSGT